VHDKEIVMAAATARVVVLMPPEEKERLAEQARQAGVSVGEFIRRSVAEHIADLEFEAELEKRRPEFETLLDELEQSNDRTMRSLDEAEATLKETLAYLRKPRAERVAG
jgi:excinuclease UvrABC ATPase subunit